MQRLLGDRRGPSLHTPDKKRGIKEKKKKLSTKEGSEKNGGITASVRRLRSIEGKYKKREIPHPRWGGGLNLKKGRSLETSKRANSDLRSGS